ncbi:unnamed protein product [Prunus brigantina]
MKTVNEKSKLKMNFPICIPYKKRDLLIVIRRLLLQNN